MRTIARILRRVLKWTTIALGVLAQVVIIGGGLVFRAIVEPDSGQFGKPPDETRQAGRTAQSLAAVARSWYEEPADCSYFARMDKGLLVKPADGADYPKEIVQVAALTKLTQEQVRQSA